MKLSEHQLSCGYVQIVRRGGVERRLWKEHGAYHVREHSDTEGRIFWESFPTITRARERFYKPFPHRREAKCG